MGRDWCGRPKSYFQKNPNIDLTSCRMTPILPRVVAAQTPIFDPGLALAALIHQATIARSFVISTLMDLLAGATDPNHRRQLVALLLRATASPILSARSSSRPGPPSADPTGSQGVCNTAPNPARSSPRSAPTAMPPRHTTSAPDAPVAAMPPRSPAPHPQASVSAPRTDHPDAAAPASSTFDPAVPAFPERRSPIPRAACLISRAGAAIHPP